MFSTWIPWKLKETPMFSRGFQTVSWGLGRQEQAYPGSSGRTIPTATTYAAVSLVLGPTVLQIFLFVHPHNHHKRQVLPWYCLGAEMETKSFSDLSTPHGTWALEARLKVGKLTLNLHAEQLFSVSLRKKK